MRIMKLSLARRMAALILAGTGLVLISVLGFSYIYQRSLAFDFVMSRDEQLSQAVLNRIEEHLAAPRTVVDQMALFLAGSPHQWNRHAVDRLIYVTLSANTRIVGMAVALSAHISEKSDFKILYGLREGDRFLVSDRESPGLDYQHDWFYLPSYLKTPQWIDPYYDPDARMLMVTYSVPILVGNDVVAVVTCDLSLEDIRRMLDELSLGEKGIAVLLSRWGTFISHPRRELEMRETIFSLAEALDEVKMRESIIELGRRMISGESGHFQYRSPFDGDMALAHYASIPSTGWSLGIIRPKAQVLEPLRHINKISALVGVTGVILLLIPALAIAWSVARPLRKLADSAERLAKGDFEAPLPEIRNSDEVAMLTGAFSRMRNDLRRYIDDLTATTAARERIESELSIAREIQLGIVPKLFPPYPERRDIDLHASLVPAREVGGDLYDFGLLDDDHLYIVIGDVSGKGVPASLLMAVGKTMLKSAILNLRNPGRALGAVNEDIAADNESCMFITIFRGILNLATGDFIYANGGHNPPLLVRGAENIINVDAKSGPALGIIPGSVYHNHSIRVEAGDLLVLYTDGITEAANRSDELYGEKRLLEYAARCFAAPVRDCIEGLKRSVEAFADGAEQSDDITSLIVRYHGRGPGENTLPGDDGATDRPSWERIFLSNRLEELERLAAWLNERAETLALSKPLLMDLNLVLEEWFVNVTSYAFTDDTDHRIEVRIRQSGNELHIEVEDDGEPFDPTVRADVDTSLSLEERPIGGLGIHFIRSRMDGFHYRREGSRNVVTLLKKLPSSS
ncbi:MAG: SpoIIE family protein phosphatase [Syntrophales bacterium]|nr:SpoIIE family protein phosphatase [Syntrophales bacterium]